MKLSGIALACLCIFLLQIHHLQAQVRTETTILQKASAQRFRENEISFQKLLQISKEKGWQMMITNKKGGVSQLVGTDILGYPMYLTLDDNIRSAGTIRTNLLWPGGISGLSLSGSSANLKGKLGVWDGGKVRSTHVELNGRVLQKDNASVLSLHSTHVAGTLIAAGVNPRAKGMAFGAQQLIAYDFSFESDLPEMLLEASNLLVSNHSYSGVAGWNFNSDSSRWEFFGLPNATEDFKFGYYSNGSMMYDSIAYNAPLYLIVSASGNQRTETGPKVGEPYWRYDANRNMIFAGNRPEGISSNDTYDIITDRSLAKNVLTVGSIAAFPNGYSISSGTILSDFSSTGPTDDGRIKPDVVANGENLLSSVSATDNSYATLSGTSMASPSAAGSLFLLQEQYSQLHAGAFMRSATLKGIITHTADDAGNAGPDYQYGWGVINMEKAAAVISANNTTQLIAERTLANGETYSVPLLASGKVPLSVTLSWTDPKGVVENVNILNNRAKRLINDLDIRIRRGTDTYLPYILDLNNPGTAATRGDNITDNLEKILIDNAVPGQTYTLTVSHKGGLQRGSQAYSLIISGVGGAAYCSSAPSVTAGSRIDSLSLGTTGYGNPAGCTAYTNKTSSVLPIEASKGFPFFVKLSSCDASAASKLVKIFIDYNNDGDFLDTGESIFTSNLVSSAGTVNGLITTPASLTAGSSLVMRVIVQEAASATEVVNPCGSYPRGETQDYLLKVIAPSVDLGVSDIISPASATCGNIAQYVTVKLTNYGTAASSNIPVTCVVRSGTITVATLTAVFPDTIAAQSAVNFTIPSSFNAVPGTTYTLTISTNSGTDQNIVNNGFASTVAVNAVSAPAAATAEVCGTTTAVLKTSAGSGDIVSWYASATATTPVAQGASASTSTIPANKTFYLSYNEVPGRAGLPSRAVSNTGGYLNAVVLVYFNTSQPLTIDNMRLYAGGAGKVTITLADSVKITGNNISYLPTASSVLDIYSTQKLNPTNDTGAIFAVNLPVNVPGQHALLIQFSGNATLFVNSGIAANPYPITLPGVISITGNSVTSATDPLAAQKYYLYFYDIGVKLANCPTGRIPVVATTIPVPVVTLAGNVLTSSATSGNQWYLNGLPITGATGQSFTATGSGIYKTIVTSATACSLGSNEVNFSATPVVDINGTEIKLIASPNPNKGQFYLQFEVKGKDDLSISMINDLGQKVYSTTYPAFTGRFAQQIKPTGKVGPGMYLLKIEHNKKVYVRKLIVQMMNYE